MSKWNNYRKLSASHPLLADRIFDKNYGLSASIRLFVDIVFIVLLLLVLTARTSAHLVGIEPGTIFAPSNSDTDYVLWDTSMNSISINNWTIYLEGHLFNIEPNTGDATVDINYWRPPHVDININTLSNVHFETGGYVAQKHYRVYINNVYHSMQADAEGEILTAIPCFGMVLISTTGEWDINVDGTVNYLDLSAIVGNYGQTGNEGWIPADINDDGKINYLELSYIVCHYC